MKKLFTFSLLILGVYLVTFSGGINTNTNQSIYYTRMMCRDASLNNDAVFYNPAGLTFLSDGIHLSINNQSIIQNRTVGSDLSILQNKEFKGKVTAPLFPSIYGTYKTGKIALSAGFNPIGGGGGAEYKDGLPSFESQVAALVPKLSEAGVTGYDADIYFKGSSVFYGIQAGVSYEINEMISVFAGARYVIAKNTYEGHLKDISVVTPTGTVLAGAYLTGLADMATTGITHSTAAVNGIQAFEDAGIPGSLTFDEARAIPTLTAEQVAQLTAIEEGLAMSPVPAADNTLDGAQTAYSNAVTMLTVQAATLNAYVPLVGDKNVDAEQAATGITPIFGVNLTLMEKLNIGIKYEIATSIDLENSTKTDDTGLFPDGEKNRADMPAYLSIGAGYDVNEKLYVTGGMHMYFDKSADYGKKVAGLKVDNDEVIDNNYLELAVAGEYAVNDKISASLGYLFAKTGVNEKYQSDISFSNSSSTIGLGGMYKLNEMLGINIGVSYTMYGEESKVFAADAATGMPAYKETYDKDALIVGIGFELDF